jgi:hypothetical protein
MIAFANAMPTLGPFVALWQHDEPFLVGIVHLFMNFTTSGKEFALGGIFLEPLGGPLGSPSCVLTLGSGQCPYSPSGACNLLFS